jgi:phage shock protein PspC (stress-responsive transcriptional regulator)
VSSSKFVRIRSEGILGGVCAGLGAYLRIDPVFVRIFFVLLAFADGIGVIAYLILWLLLPNESSQEGQTFDATVRENAGELAERARSIGTDFSQGFEGANPQLPMIIGGALIILGFAFLIENLNIAWLSWIRYEVLWPLLLILAGVVLLFRRAQGD